MDTHKPSKHRVLGELAKNFDIITDLHAHRNDFISAYTSGQTFDVSFQPTMTRSDVNRGPSIHGGAFGHESRQVMAWTIELIEDRINKLGKEIEQLFSDSNIVVDESECNLLHVDAFKVDR